MEVKNRQGLSDAERWTRSLPLPVLTRSKLDQTVVEGFGGLQLEWNVAVAAGYLLDRSRNSTPIAAQLLRCFDNVGPPMQ